MVVVACGPCHCASLMLKSSELSSLSSLSSSFHVSELVPISSKGKSRFYSPAFELRTPQALGSSPGYEKSEIISGGRRAAIFGLEIKLRQKLGRTHALGSLPDLDMFNDPR